jgi:hypothetical protein
MRVRGPVVIMVVIARGPVVVAMIMIVRVAVVNRGTAAEDADEHSDAHGGDQGSAGDA